MEVANYLGLPQISSRGLQGTIGAALSRVEHNTRQRVVRSQSKSSSISFEKIAVARVDILIEVASIKVRRWR